MNKKDFDTFFRNFHFIGCAVRSSNIVYLLGRQLYESEEGGGSPEEPDVDKRVINIVLDRVGAGRYGQSTLADFGVCNISVQDYPKHHSVTIDYQGQVWGQGSGILGVEKSIGYDLENGPQRGGVIRVKKIGSHVYGVGARRSVCKRLGVGEWKAVWDGLPIPVVKRSVELNNFGFADIDGFDETDIYAVGGNGDVWQFDGNKWSQISFPTNQDLRNVCCGKDGRVYIAAQGGVTYRGRHDVWEKVSDACTAQWFKDMVWYQNKLWATNDYSIWCLGDKGFNEPDLPDFVRSSAGSMSEADGILLLAGMYGSSLYDGGKWVSLVDLVDLYKKYGA
ncbi:hypothetical protein [Diaphorobacter caeni]|uniref:hypothetical protein n=1 Tax=Diaphorobacter caeni TaxID=2784387 RepID=UPI001890ADC1|nr:hypothetical protein [Diaphorobacter caeni]MBF5005298.1 hypothetical protein [Diaphorobacter caeni]